MCIWHVYTLYNHWDYELELTLKIKLGGEKSLQKKLSAMAAFRN